MPSSASDKRYGRQGGRLVPWDRPVTPPPCTECGGPVYGHTTGDAPATHQSCRPDTKVDDDQLGFDFGGDAA